PGCPSLSPVLVQALMVTVLTASVPCFQAVTGRSFAERDFRAALENGILLCQLLSCISPGLVKKVNKLQTHIAGLENLCVFLRGCEDLGLKGSQLFDPGDLQETSPRPTAKPSEESRKINNVLVTLYWLGRAANSCVWYSGPALDLTQFSGLLAQMRQEEVSPKASSIRDSGYIDCWDSERSDSLSPPRHAREDSFDSLDSLGSRSRHTPSPDVLAPRGSSDGRGSDSESDSPTQRKVPDVRKDDMLARRTSVSEPRAAVPFNQYLPTRSQAAAHLAPAPLQAAEEVPRSSWSTTSSPVGGDRPLRSVSMIDMRGEEVGLQPHCQARHEGIHSQYHRMKDDDDHWQDDLARWKTRRRSVSQDLMRKEEERKRMEQLMSGGGASAQRRKSIKTYREIVEDKERREEELRLAYRSARSPEEAAVVLQRYTQRFSISEAVMERLQLPKLLDHGPASPLSPLSPLGPAHDSDGPMRFLRQQSAPAPRFTATVEARVEEVPRGSSPSSPPHRPQIRSRSSEPPCSRAPLSPEAGPLSVSGRKLCSSCGRALGKGAAMIIETLGLFFHIQCFKCGVCRGLLGDTTTGTDVRIRNGLLNCHQCYIRSRSAGQPTTL
uniref:LIM and calponin homology domains 1 n=1 Tax=Gadus morhua TaxID=8049 RepID=A0A8C5A8V7_GADMO